MERRKVHDLRGPWNLFSLSSQQVLLSFLSSLFFSQRSHLCHQWTRQSIMNKVSDLPQASLFVLKAGRDTETLQLNSLP